MNIPESIPTARVSGNIMRVVLDNHDPGDAPNLGELRDVRVTVTAETPYVEWSGGLLILDPFTFTVNQAGDVVDPSNPDSLRKIPASLGVDSEFLYVIEVTWAGLKTPIMWKAGAPVDGVLNVSTVVDPPTPEQLPAWVATLAAVEAARDEVRAALPVMAQYLADTEAARDEAEEIVTGDLIDDESSAVNRVLSASKTRELIGSHTHDAGDVTGVFGRDQVPAATASEPGVARFATPIEATEGVVVDAAVTPEGLAAALAGTEDVTLVDERLHAALSKDVCTVVLIGSSTTGSVSSRAVWPETFAPLVWSKYGGGSYTKPGQAPADRGIRFINYGFGGARANQISAAEKTEITALNPDIVFHCHGASEYNDGSAPSVFAANLTTQITSLNLPDAMHIIMHQHERLGVTSAYTWDGFGAAGRGVADAASNRLFVDVSHRMRELGVGPGLGDRYGFFLDNAHLNAHGARVLGQMIAEQLGIHSSGVGGGWENLTGYLASGKSGNVYGKISGDVVTISATSVGPYSSTVQGYEDIFVTNALPVRYRARSNAPDRQYGVAVGSDGARNVGVALARGGGRLSIALPSSAADCRVTITYQR